MKNIILSFIVLMMLSSISCFSQDFEAFERKNSVQLELGGHGLFYSFNYERILFDNGKFKTAGQIGVSYYPPFIGYIDVWMPIGINEIVSFGHHHFEAGMGIIIIREASRDADNNAVEWSWDHFLSARIGYRFQKPDSRFLFRAGFSPIIETNLFRKNDPISYDYGIFTDFHPLPSVAIGYLF